MEELANHPTTTPATALKITVSRTEKNVYAFSIGKLLSSKKPAPEAIKVKRQSTRTLTVQFGQKSFLRKYPRADLPLDIMHVLVEWECDLDLQKSRAGQRLGAQKTNAMLKKKRPNHFRNMALKRWGKK